MIMCRKTDNNNPSERDDLLTGRHYSDFWLFPKLRGCRYETIEMKEAVTKVIDMLTQEDFLRWGLPEVVATVQVHCSRRRLLQRGLEFHVCIINKSAHMKKVWKLI